jgi:invasion protein IalB
MASKAAKVGIVSGQKTGILVTVIFTAFSLNKLKAGKNDTSEVWNTPMAKKHPQKQAR